MQAQAHRAGEGLAAITDHADSTWHCVRFMY
jgi:hypothetical protein